MSERQSKCTGISFRLIFVQALLFTFFLLNFGPAERAYGSGSDVVGKYIHVVKGQQHALATAFGRDGSKVIVGYSQLSSLDPEYYYVAKISADGNSLVWSVPAVNPGSGTVGRAMAVGIDSQSNVVVMGAAFNGVNYDIYTVKYTENGVVSWSNSVNGTRNGDDIPVALAFDMDNNIYIGGYTLGSNSHEDFFTLKYNATGPVGGKPTWQKTYNGAADNVDKISAIAVSHTPSTYVAVTGSSRNATDTDILTVKYDGAGNFLWAKTKDGGSGDDWGKKVKMDSGGNVIVTGYVNNGLDADIYLAKYTGNGASPTVDWQVPYNGGYGDEPRDLAVDSEDNVYVTGFTYSLTSGFNNYFTAKYYGTGTNKGTLAWPVKIYDSGGNNIDTALGLAVSDDAVYVTGTVYKSASEDEDIVTIKYRKDNGSQVWVSTFDGMLGKNDVPVGIGISLDDGMVQVSGSTEVPAVDLGTASNGTGSTTVLTDATKTWTVNQWKGCSLLMALGLSRGESRAITGNTGTGITVSPAFPGNMVAGDSYYIYVAPETATGGSTTSVQNTSKTWLTNQWTDYYVVMTSGSNKGLSKKIASNTGTTLTLAETFPIAVVAGNSYIIKGTSDLDFVGLRLDPGILDTPSDLNAELISSSEVKLTWTLNSTTETGVEISRMIDGTLDNVITIGHGLTSYNDTGLTADTRYNYKIRVYDGSSFSFFSNEVSVLTSFISYASPTWKYTYTGPDGYNDVAHGVAVGPDNNPVVTGSSISAEGSFDYYTVKLNHDNAGEIWSAPYNDEYNDIDEAQGVTVDNNNDAIVFGYSYLNSTQRTLDYYTIKYYAANGLSFNSPIWARQEDCSVGGNEQATAIVLSKDSSNNIVVAGYGRAVAGNDDIYVVKYLADGTRSWSKVYDRGSDDRPLAVAFDGNGDIIVTGKSHNGTDFDMLTRKLSGATGLPVWTVIKNGGHGDDEGVDLAIGRDNSVYVTGSITNASGYKDIYTVNYNSAAAADGVTGEIKQVGGTPWEMIHDGAGHGNDWPASLRGDTNGDVDHIVVAGTTQQSIGGKHDFVAIWYDSLGNKVRTKLLDRLSNDDKAIGMAMDVTGNICVAGNTDSGNGDIMTVKYGYEGNLIATTLYDGTNHGVDVGYAVGAGRNGKIYVAGYTTNAGGNKDMLAFKCEGNVLQMPSPFNSTPDYLKIDFTWVNNSADADGVRLRRQVGSCVDAVSNNWSPFILFTAGQTGYSDTGLNKGTTYCYQIQAYKGTDASRLLEKTVATLDIPAPGAFTATAYGMTTMKLAWTDNVNGEDSFEIQRCTGSGTGCDADNEFTSLVTLGSGTVQYDDSTVCAGTTYTYRIQAHKTDSWDSYWASVTAATPAIATPTMTSAAAQSEGRIDLAWTDTNIDHSGFKVYRCAGAGCTPATLVGTLTAVAKPSGNVLYLQMDESAWTGAAGQIIDTSGANNNARAYNSVTTTTEGRNSSRAGNFDGIDDYIYWGTYSGGRPTNDFTIAAWVKATTTHEIDTQANSGTTGTSGQKFLFWPDQMAAPDSGAGVSVGTNGISVYELAGGYMPPLAVYSGSLGTGWNHIVVTYTNKQPRIYLNGVLKTTGLTSPRTSVYAPTRVGGAVYGYFAGIVDEVAVYNRPLSDAEVAGYYNYMANFKGIADLPLLPNTAYRYAVSAYKTGVAPCLIDLETNPVAGGVLSATTHNVTDPGHVPVLLTVTKDATERTSKINLTWQDNTETEENFKIERCAGATCDFSSIDATYTVAADETSYSDLEACQGAYRYRVKALRQNTPVWTSNPSNVLGATTDTVVAPSGLAWDAANSNEEQVKLNWTANTMDETGFEIWRCTGSGCSNFGASSIATVGRGVTTYTDTRLNPDTIYRYKIRAVKSSGCTWQSGYSSTLETNTNVSNKGSLNLTASSPNTTQIDLGWSDITGNETGFALERCSGTCDSGGSFSTKYGLDSGVTGYSDVTGICHGQTYSYRVKVIDQEFSYGYNGCWTKRVQLTTITGFQANSVIEFTINNATDMQADFDDVRFYQFTDGTLLEGQVLPHWISKKTDGTSGTATIWLKTGANANCIYMYYGNPNAAKVQKDGGVFEFFDDFAGTTVDSSKWESNNSTYLYQNNGLRLISNTSYSYSAFTSKVKFYRDAIRTLYYRSTMATTSELWDAGLSSDVVDTNNTFVHGLIYNTNIITKVYENVTRNITYKYFSFGYPYEFKIVYAVNGGAKYYIRGGGGSYVYNTWTLIYDSTANYPLVANDPMRVKVRQLNAAVVIDALGVFKYDLVAVTIGLGAVQGDGVACNTMPHEWVSVSNIVIKAAKTATPPTGLTAGTITESDLSFSWTSTTADETGVRVERCIGNAAACASGPFTQIAVVASPTHTYTDSGLLKDTSYTYRLASYKSATCSWDIGYSSSLSLTTLDLPAPTSVQATVNSSTDVTVTWVDNTTSNTSFEVARSAWNGTSWGSFVSVGTTGGNTTSFTDNTACKGTQYKYQVWAVKAPPSGWSTAKTESNTVNTPDLITKVYTELVNGVAWSKRKFLSISNFQPNYQTKVVIPCCEGMKADFADIRFFDATAGVLLDYWIESKTDGATATVWVETGANNKIYLYYGNLQAASASNGVATFTFFDDFSGGSLDTTKWWAGCDAAGCLPYAQMDGVFRFGTGLSTSDYRYTYLRTSPSTYSRPLVEEYTQNVIAGYVTSPGMWRLESSGGYAYLQRYSSSGWRWGYMNGTTATVLANTTGIVVGNTVKVKRVWDDTSVKIYQNDTYVTQNTHPLTGATWMGLAVYHPYKGQTLTIDIDDYRIRKYAAVEPVVALGSVQNGPFVEDRPVLSATRYSESRIDLAWFWDAGDFDETGYKIERCIDTGTSCTTFTVPANTASYSDTGLISNTTYCYRISGFKYALGSCGAANGWDTGYSAQFCATTTLNAPELTSVTMINTTQINLAWNDTTTAEQGFKIWRCKYLQGVIDCSDDNDYVLAYTLGPNQTTKEDTNLCKYTLYYYKVSAYNSAWGGTGDSPKSAALNVRTGAVQYEVMDTDETKQLNDTQIKVAWKDYNIDESGFSVARGDADCANFVEDVLVVPVSDPMANNFNTSAILITAIDSGLTPNTTYCYKVKPYKTLSSPDCAWPNKYNTTPLTVTTFVPAPTALSSNAPSPDTTTIHLKWKDSTTTEDSFEIQRCTGTAAVCNTDAMFATIKLLASPSSAGVEGEVTYDDPTVCPGQTYTYRVRAVRTSVPAWTAPSPFSISTDLTTVTTVTTVATVAPSSLSRSELYDATLDQRRIDLFWTDANADETGFKIERCKFTVSENCNDDSDNYEDVGMHSYYSMNETFTSQIDPLVWKQQALLQGVPEIYGPPIDIQNRCGSAKIFWYDGTAVLQTTAHQVWEYDWCGIDKNYNYSLLVANDPQILGNADFDISFDFSMLYSVPPGGGNNYADVPIRLQIAFPKQSGKTMRDVISVERNNKQNANMRYTASATIRDVTQSAEIATTDYSGKLRVNRTANKITMSYWKNNAWVTLLSHTENLASDMPEEFFFGQYVQRTPYVPYSYYVGPKVAIDNIKIVAAGLKYSDLAPNSSSTYYYRVRAYKNDPGGAENTCPAWQKLRTDAVPEATNPARPTNLVARAAGSKMMELIWTDNATDESSYIVEKKMAGGSYIVIATLAANKTRYVDTLNLDPNTSYTYRIRAFRNSDSSYSPYSNEATGKTFVWGTLNRDDTTCQP